MRPILEAVRKRGDKALLEYARKFDDLERKTVACPSAELARGSRKTDARISRRSRDRLAQHPAIRPDAGADGAVNRVRPGPQLGQIVRPLDTVAAYIPGGRYPLPSTLMMTVIPAQVAGVRRIMVACPRPVAGNSGHARLLGVERSLSDGRRPGDRRLCVWHAHGSKGGPHRGTGEYLRCGGEESASGHVGIDFIAGPTEIVIIAAEGDPKFIAADMLARRNTMPMRAPSC